MPFIPHTEKDLAQMLAAIDAKAIEDLFDEIPPDLRVKSLEGIPEGMTEWEVSTLLLQRAAKMSTAKCFIGAGAYEHHIPAAVWDVATRGEFLTCYTPYQAEASQGTLQVIFEYQTMMASLMGLDVSNASLYDGATALVEAILMAIRLQKHKAKHSVWIPGSLHPHYRQVLATLLAPLDVQLLEIPFNAAGHVEPSRLDLLWQQEGDCTALVIAQPNFFGCLEDVDRLTNWAQAHQALVIGVVNPLAMALLKPPGQWGEKGADLACGEGQPLGVPLAGGGPYFGFLCCRQQDVRQLPGRLVGKTVDREGNPGYVLTLQAREQHIRRGKATSNICTNQGLLVTAATIYLSLLGPSGLRKVAVRCQQLTAFFIREIKQISQIQILFNGPRFHEVVIALPISAALVLKRMEALGFAAGFSLEHTYPDLKNTLLVCLTETKTEEDIQQYVAVLKKIVEKG